MSIEQVRWVDVWVSDWVDGWMNGYSLMVILISGLD